MIYTYCRRFYIKLFSWEYWPMWVVYFPVSFYYLYLAIKARTFFFFSAANPTIETGGMFFESKWKIFQLIPKEYFPATILIHTTDSIEMIAEKMNQSSIHFPIIAKPDRGERGWCVKKIETVEELIAYKNNVNVEFLIQTYIAAPIELSVFYFRHPSSSSGNITSVTYKKLLTIVGDGSSTIDQLIQKNDRAFLQYHQLKQNHSIDLNKVLQLGESAELVPYGNHVLGAEFIDYHFIVDEQLTSTFNKIANSINGFYYGRFDLRCNSIEEMKLGKHIYILELNGAGAEPAHIYDPNYSFIKAQKVLAKHYKMLFIAAITNFKKGVPFITYQEIKEWRTKEKAYKKQISLT